MRQKHTDYCRLRVQLLANQGLFTSKFFCAFYIILLIRDLCIRLPEMGKNAKGFGVDLISITFRLLVKSSPKVLMAQPYISIYFVLCFNLIKNNQMMSLAQQANQIFKIFFLTTSTKTMVAPRFLTISSQLILYFTQNLHF